LTILVLIWGLNPNLSSAQADGEIPAETDAEKPIYFTIDRLTLDGKDEVPEETDAEKPFNITSDHFTLDVKNEVSTETDTEKPIYFTINNLTLAESEAEPESEKPINVTADHIIQDGKKDIIIAKGHVIVRHKGNVLRADWVKINNKTGRGEAIGHVMLTQKNGTKLKAKRTLFNIKSKRAKFFNARGVIGKNYYISGKEIIRLSDNHYKLKNASLTTCRGTLPDWEIEASWIDLKNGDRALFTHGWFKIRDIPVLYLPVGYIPINRNRKSGFLFPSFGISNTDGFHLKNSYYWVINQSHDATLSVDYIEKRGIQPELEYRYAPSDNIRGEILGSYLKDDLTGGEFWKVDGIHEQSLPKNFKLKGKLDLESNTGFNKLLEDNRDLRTRRSCDSFASINRIWTNNTLDIIARFRDSTEEKLDDTFFLLPQVTYKTQKIPIGNSLLYFNQDSSYTFFEKDLNTSPQVDDTFNVHRLDFHPQISAPTNITPWLAFTPTIGVRETYYSKGRDANNKKYTSFSRESFDFQAAFEGPKINKIFHLDSKKYPKIKHLIEPRVTYDFIPEMDDDDRSKIRVLDAVDSVAPTSRVTYSLTQRLLRKETIDTDEFQTREIMRFDISQSYDLREATRATITGRERKPLSEIRFDLDSRLMDGLLLNADTAFDLYRNTINTINVELGIKPTSNLSLYLEKRYTRNSSNSLMATIDWAFEKGWRFQLSSRFDEESQTFRENELSLMYDNPCRCWGFSFDVINRDLLNNGQRLEQTKFQFSFILRGLGSFRSSRKELTHREF